MQINNHLSWKERSTKMSWKIYLEGWWDHFASCKLHKIGKAAGKRWISTFLSCVVQAKQLYFRAKGQNNHENGCVHLTWREEGAGKEDASLSPGCGVNSEVTQQRTFLDTMTYPHSSPKHLCPELQVSSSCSDSSCNKPPTPGLADKVPSKLQTMTPSNLEPSHFPCNSTK